jgi:DNA-binding SARP family transcriptional activator
MGGLAIRLLGAFQVTLNGQPVTGFESNKGRALLAYLAVEANRPHSRDTLAGLFWPDHADEVARHNLRQVLSNLRQVLQDQHAESSFLYVTRQTLQFNVTSPHQLDVSNFTRLLDTCAAHTACHLHLTPCESCLQRLVQAEALYSGEFLAGFFVADSAPFEEWLLMQRERFHRLAWQALGQLTDHYTQRRDYSRAGHYARRRVMLEPWQEESSQQLMRLLARSGQPNAALAHYAACRQTLAADLGVEPMPETTALYERIRTARAMRRCCLPTYPTPFIGREQELTEISQRLTNPACRLLTLVGPVGIGKTRLAVQAAADCGREFLHGVCFAPLTAVSSVDVLVSALAGALDISLTGPGSPKTQLFNYLREKEILLVLDNFEHLLAGSLAETHNDGAALVTELLQAAPEVKLCITSRKRLNLPEEWLFDVTGLTFPASASLPADESLVDPSAEALKTYSAVQLFTQAVQRIQSNFTPTATDYYFIGRVLSIARRAPGAGISRRLEPSVVVPRNF